MSVQRKPTDQANLNLSDPSDRRNEPVSTPQAGATLLDPPESTPESCDDRDPEHATPAQADPEAAGSDIPEGDLGGFGAVLTNGNFLILWLAQVLSQLADKVVLVLIISLISTHFQAEGDSISGWVSGVMFTFTLPAILFGTLAGVYVDRWSKKWILVGTNLARGLLVLVLPLAIWLSPETRVWGDLPLGFVGLLAITFLVSTLTQYFAPAEQATLPLIVTKGHLLSANSLYATTMVASVIVGFAIGEPVLALAEELIPPLLPIAGLGPTLLVGGSYGLASLLLLPLQTQEHWSRSEDKQRFWRDILTGLRYIRRTAAVRAALIQIVVLYSVFAALAVLAVRLAELTPALETTQFGFLLAAAGLGMGLGACVTGQVGYLLSRRQWALMGSVGLGLLLIGLAYATSHLWIAVGVIGGIGFTGALAIVPMQTEIQDKTPKRLRGKVFGLQNNLANIALSLPLGVAGVAEAALGLAPVLWGLGGITVIGGIVTWQISVAVEGGEDAGR